MGQAKRRGTYEQRKAAAMAWKEAPIPDDAEILVVHNELPSPLSKSSTMTEDFPSGPAIVKRIMNILDYQRRGMM